MAHRARPRRGLGFLFLQVTFPVTGAFVLLGPSLTFCGPLGRNHSSSPEDSDSRRARIFSAFRARRVRRRAAFLPGTSSRTAIPRSQCGHFIYAGRGRLSQRPWFPPTASLGIRPLRWCPSHHGRLECHYVLKKRTPMATKSEFIGDHRL